MWLKASSGGDLLVVLSDRRPLYGEGTFSFNYMDPINNEIEYSQETQDQIEKNSSLFEARAAAEAEGKMADEQQQRPPAKKRPSRTP